MTAKEFLQQIEQKETLVKNKLAERRRWERALLENASNISVNMSGERVQTSGNKQRMADSINRDLDRIRAIDKRIAELYAEMDSIIAVIEQLPAVESDILHKVYVQHLSLKEVAAIRNEAYSTVAHKHHRALAMVRALMSNR